MHPDLEILLEIQDLKTQRSELAELSAGRTFEEEVFNITVDDALVLIDEKIAEMEASLDPTIRSRFQRLAGTRTRFIVPVINGTCFGCFVSIPTAMTSQRNQDLQFCDSCGRFLYMVG